MSGSPQISISTNDVLGRPVICYQSTLDKHRLKHQEPFSDEDIIRCIKSPDIIARSGHSITGHEFREVYYLESGFVDVPPMMKVVIDHQNSPGVMTSMFRTSKHTQDGAIVYSREGYLEEKLGKL